MFEGFVNPGLVAGVGLASVPLLIHLLNRQRHRPMRWAAMRFVLAAYRKTRRRVQLENLLLLLLRMGAVALLALCVARPFAAGDGAFAPLTEKRRDLLVVLDGSASTRFRENVRTVFENIVSRTEALLGDLDGSTGDRAQILLAGSRPRAYGWSNPEDARSLLSTVTPTDESLDLAATLSEVLAIVEEDAAGTGRSAVEVRLLTDLQRNAFAELVGEGTARQSAEEGAAAAHITAHTLDELQELGVQILVEDHGPTDRHPANLGISDVHPVEEMIGERVRLEIAVKVTNHGEKPRPAERVSLVFDGNKLPVQRVDIPAGGTAEAVFPIQATEPGPHTMHAALEGDHLAIDDRRSGVTVVPPPLSVLVVNGAPADDIIDDEVGLLLLALEPMGDDDEPGAATAAPFRANEVTSDWFWSGDLDLGPYDVIILANVGGLPPELVEALEEHVSNGASLIIAMGDRVADLDGYNRKLFRADGSGLLPAELSRQHSVPRREGYFRVASFEGTSPIFSFFDEELWKPLLTEVPIYTFVETLPLQDAKVLATLDDVNRSALLIERPRDRGKVFLWTSGFSRAWSDIPASPKTLVPLLHEWLLYAGRTKEDARVVSPGEPVTLTLSGFPRSPELVHPDGSRRALDGEPVELSDGRWQLPPIAGTATSSTGLYQVTLASAPDEPFAVALDPAEGNLRRMSRPEFDTLHKALVLIEETGSGQGEADTSPGRGEIWRWMAAAALLFLISESLWSAWIGQRRRVPA